MGERTRGSFTASQVSAGRKNRLSLEIFGTKGSVAWDGERPNELWIGSRNTPNQIIVKDPSLLKEQARPFAELPGGHAEGYGDTFKQVFERFYASIESPGSEPEYPQFTDGVRQLTLIESALASSRAHSWVEVPS
jgi:predicted dehydrogenase